MFYRIKESFQLEETFKTIKSNHYPQNHINFLFVAGRIGGT